MLMYDYHIEQAAKTIDFDLNNIMRKVIEAGFENATIEITPGGYDAVATLHFWRDHHLYSIDKRRDGNYGEVRSDKEVFAWG